MQSIKKMMKVLKVQIQKLTYQKYRVNEILNKFNLILLL